MTIVTYPALHRFSYTSFIFRTVVPNMPRTIRKRVYQYSRSRRQQHSRHIQQIRKCRRTRNARRHNRHRHLLRMERKGHNGLRVRLEKNHRKHRKGGGSSRIYENTLIVDVDGSAGQQLHITSYGSGSVDFTSIVNDWRTQASNVSQSPILSNINVQTGQFTTTDEGFIDIAPDDNNLKANLYFANGTGVGDIRCRLIPNHTKQIYMFGEMHYHPDDTTYVRQYITQILNENRQEIVDVYIETRFTWNRIDTTKAYGSGGALGDITEIENYLQRIARIRLHSFDIRGRRIQGSERRGVYVDKGFTQFQVMDVEMLFKLLFEKEYWPEELKGEELNSIKNYKYLKLDDILDDIEQRLNHNTVYNDLITGYSKTTESKDDIMKNLTILKSRMTKQLKEFLISTRYSKSKCIQNIYEYLQARAKTYNRYRGWIMNSIPDIYGFLRMFRVFFSADSTPYSSSHQPICIYLAHWGHCHNQYDLVIRFFKDTSYKLRGMTYMPTRYSYSQFIQRHFFLAKFLKHPEYTHLHKLSGKHNLFGIGRLTLDICEQTNDKASFETKITYPYHKGYRRHMRRIDTQAIENK